MSSRETEEGEVVIWTGVMRESRKLLEMVVVASSRMMRGFYYLEMPHC